MNIPAVTHRGRGIDCYPLDEHLPHSPNHGEGRF